MVIPMSYIMNSQSLLMLEVQANSSVSPNPESIAQVICCQDFVDGRGEVRFAFKTQ